MMNNKSNCKLILSHLVNNIPVMSHQNLHLMATFGRIPEAILKAFRAKCGEEA